MNGKAKSNLLDLHHLLIMTLLLVLILVALIGGAVVIWGDPGSLSFQDYLNALWKFAAAIAGATIGNGLLAHLNNGHGGDVNTVKVENIPPTPQPIKPAEPAHELV